MTISKRDAKLLLVLGGIMIFLALYLLVYNKFTEKAEAVAAETAALMPELQELRSIKTQEPKLREDIEACREDIAELSIHFPNDVRSEDLIMFSSTLEDQIGMYISSAGFTPPVSLLDFTGVLDGENGDYSALPLSAWSAGLSLSCQLTYPQLKKAIDYLYMQQNVTVLDSVTVSFDSATGELFGTMNINKYFITGADDTYYETRVPSTPLGTENIFGTVTPEAPVTPAAPAAPVTPATPAA